MCIFAEGSAGKPAYKGPYFLFRRATAFFMDKMNEDFVTKHYGNQLRFRVSGICTEGDKLLLVLHKGLGRLGELWLPPGGGLETGQTAPENLKREFLEETGLEVEVGNFLFIHEHLQGSLHAIELFFAVRTTGGRLSTGSDPELPPDKQLIQEVRYFTFDELKALGDQRLHAMLQHCNSLEELNNAKGYFKFGK